ncbi:MAG: ABC transporter permease, partial [Spirochaetia bacterium]|nr:ABC transporter permease [Spirochaetia bacterium]
MYKWFALKRVLKGIFTYIIIIFILSALFNTVNEQTMRANIEEQVRAESVKLKNMQPSAIQKFQQQRKEELIR